MRRLLELLERPSRVVVGLMSGTSADGVDAAVVRVHGCGPETRVELLGFHSFAFPDPLREEILGLRTADARALARWNVGIARLFVHAAREAVAAAGLELRDIDLVGSHGQTVVHIPRDEDEPAVTLQIGDGSVIAAELGVPVICDFRQADIAAGGEGAPLVPWVDWLLLRPESWGGTERCGGTAGAAESAGGGIRLVQNLGGVGNVTVVTRDPGAVIAFDTGPANGPLDAAAVLVSGGALGCDTDGALAASGTVDADEVANLLRHPFFALPPPKSIDRALFAEPFVAALRARRPDLDSADLLATLTEFVARSIVDAYRRHVPAFDTAIDVVVSGGGTRNPVLMGRLRALLDPLRVRLSTELGVDADAKEAIAFAVLANETLHGRPGNLPSATGARRAVVLGKLAP